MNDRIRQLLEQAGVTYAVMPKDTVYEKFAALIIEECAKVCNNIDSEYDGEDVLATWCAEEIKQHFGV